MKKTMKKQLILLAVVTVMMICGLVMTASAADIPCPAYEDSTKAHSSLYVVPVTYEPTCTQKGYTVDYCNYCARNVVDAYNYVAETGHSYTVSYRANGSGYDRILTCQNDLCYRAENSGEVDAVNSWVKDEAVYYTVEFINNYESPDSTADYHADYFEDEYYVAGSQETWLAKAYEPEYYLSCTETNDDGTVLSPAYEYISRDGTVMLFVKSGEKAPEYKGATPYRFKDLSIGRYTFSGWETNGTALADAAITANTVFEAQFTAHQIQVGYAFYDGDGKALTSGQTVPYGSEVSYGLLKTPTKESDQRYYYTFDGWIVGKDDTRIYTDKIKVYWDTSIFAHFTGTLNEYTVNFVDFYGNELGTSNDVVYGGLAKTIEGISADQLEVARDKVYIYTYKNSWLLTEHNGLKVSGTYSVNPRSFDAPASVTVITEDGTYKTVKLSDGDSVTIVPDYTRKLVEYHFKVSIKTVYFESEDLFEDNSMIRSDILDDFVVQVKDANGQYIAGGMADADGNFWFSANYSDALYITVKTTSSSKYYGEHTLNFAYATLEEIENYEFTGIGIAPKVTQEWIDGNTYSCDCICHSIFSTIVVRVYNILYRLFNIKYVCCDDLFATHGTILAYTK